MTLGIVKWMVGSFPQLQLGRVGTKNLAYRLVRQLVHLVQGVVQMAFCTPTSIQWLRLLEQPKIVLYHYRIVKLRWMVGAY